MSPVDVIDERALAAYAAGMPSSNAEDISLKLSAHLSSPGHKNFSFYKVVASTTEALATDLIVRFASW